MKQDNNNATILIIDDDTVSLTTIVECLNMRGFETIIARDGETGLRQAALSQPDLILLDVMMPDIDGFETCRRLKADERTRAIPVIFMTVLQNTEEKVKGFDSGAVDYITKPFEKKEVLVRITTHLRLRELNERLEQQVQERTRELTAANERLQQEIAERKQTEEKLRLFRAIVESSHEAVAISDPNGQLLYINPAHETLFGRSLEEARQLNYRDYYPPESLETLNRVVAPAAARGESWEGILDVFDVNGRRFPLWERTGTIVDADGTMRYGFGFMHDDTERKQAEEALVESEKQLNALLNATTDIMFLGRTDGTFLKVNDALAKSLGRKKEELVDQAASGFMSAEAAKNRTSEMQKVIASKKPLHWVDDRAGRHFENSVYPIVDDQGHVKQVAMFAKDITERKQAEDALRERDFYLKKSQEIGKLGHFNYDPISNIVEGSPLLFNIFDVEPTEPLFEAFAHAVHPEDGHLIFPLINRAVEEEIPYDVEHRVRHKDGSVLYVHAKGEIVDTSKGKRMVGTIQDITERKQAEQALREKTHALGERVKELNCLFGLSQLVETADISLSGIFQGIIERIPPAWQYPDITCARLVYADQEYKTENFLATSRQQTADIRVYGQPLGCLEVGHTEERPLRDEGQFITEERLLLNALAERLGRIIEHKQAEKTLRESEERFHTVTKISPVGIFITDIHGKTVYWNERLYEITGMSGEEGMGTTWADGVHPEDRERVFHEWYESEETRATFKSEYRFIDRSGKVTHTIGQAVPIFDIDENMTGYVGTITDITERKQVEEALRESEERYRSLVANIPGVSYRCQCDEYWTMEFISDEVEKLSGYPASDFLHNAVRSWASIMYPEGKQTAEESALGKISGKEPYTLEYRILGADGTIRWCYEKGQGVFDEQGKLSYLDGVIVDITVRKQAEEALRESEGKFRMLFEAGANAILLVDEETGAILDSNTSASDMYGYSREELTRLTVMDLSTEPEKTRHAIQLNGKTFVPLRYSRRKNGAVFPIEIYANAFELHGKTINISAIHDITERKRAEEHIKASLKEKEVLLQEIHHRVKNNLQIISSLLDMSRLRTQDQEAIDLLTDARARIHSMALIHTQLYQSDRFDQIDMGSHIRELVRYLSTVYAGRKRIRPVVEVSGVCLALTQAIPCALVLNELIANAFKHAFTDGQAGTLTISMRQSAGGTIVLRVNDDGVGIRDDVDLYQTNTMGLKLVRKLVQQQLKGEVRVERNAGTEFSITFEIVE